MNLAQLALPADKANHVIAGALVFLPVAIAVALAGHAQYARPAGAVAALVAGLLKELADWLANRHLAQQGLPPAHGVEVADAAATTAGGLLCWAAGAFTG